jgi:acyl-CoA thioester hydrolase
MTRTVCEALPVTETDIGALCQSAARPDPRRTDIRSYPFVVETQGRYGDMDANGHMNNLAVESLHEDVRARMNRTVMPGVYDNGRRPFRLVSAQNVVHFLAESTWPSVFRAAIGVGRIGTSSFVASSALFIGDACISTCDTVLVVVGDDGPRSIPDDARVRLQDLLLRVQH